MKQVTKQAMKQMICRFRNVFQKWKYTKNNTGYRGNAEVTSEVTKKCFNKAL